MDNIGVGLCIPNSVAAVELYRRAFGLTLGYHVLNNDGTYYHSELYDNGREVLNVVEAQTPIVRENPVQLAFTFLDGDALLSAVALLSDGGRMLMEPCELPWSPCAAEVVDRFGVRWYLTVPMHYPPAAFTPEDA